jgi:hypothetical protein
MRVAGRLLMLLLAVNTGARCAAQGALEATAVVGTVTDVVGALVPGVRVTLKNKVTGKVSVIVADAAGSYKFLNVTPGEATLTFDPMGLGALLVKDVLVQAGQTVTANAVLKDFQLPGPVGSTAFDDDKATPLAKEKGKKTYQATAIYTGGETREYVRVTVDAVAGPLGYAATPSLTGATQALNAQQQALVAAQRFNFPSVIFYISASPLVYLPNEGSPDSIRSAQETDRNPLWLDATFYLQPEDAQGNVIAGACTDGSVQVLGLLPQANISAPKTSVMGDVASSAVDVSGALASFYPGAATGVAAATKAMNVVFQDLFPPKPVAYQYPDMNGNCEVGWFFRANPTAAGGAGEASILGIQTGIVLLKTTKNIKQIHMNGQTLSAWSKPPTSYSKQLYVGRQADMGVVKLPNLDEIDYDSLTALAMFPSLIERAKAKQILHIASDADFVKFARANGLVGTDDAFDYVTNASVTAFLGLGAPKAAEVSKPAAADKPAVVKPAGKGTKAAGGGTVKKP